MFSFQGTIDLHSCEEEIFDLLLETVKFQNRSTILRAAGGWVRDKVIIFRFSYSSLIIIIQLLGLASDDIDIALNDQSGAQFANAVNDYLKSKGHATTTVAIIEVRAHFY